MQMTCNADHIGTCNAHDIGLCNVSCNPMHLTCNAFHMLCPSHATHTTRNAHHMRTMHLTCARHTGLCKVSFKYLLQTKAHDIQCTCHRALQSLVQTSLCTRHCNARCQYLQCLQCLLQRDANQCAWHAMHMTCNAHNIGLCNVSCKRFLQTSAHGMQCTCHRAVTRLLQPNAHDMQCILLCNAHDIGLCNAHDIGLCNVFCRPMHTSLANPCTSHACQCT